jgi:predicted RecB family nuclease
VVAIVVWPEGVANAGSRFALDCAHRVVNDRDPALSFGQRTERTEEQLLREEEGLQFEYEIRTELASHHRVLDLGLIEDFNDRTEATLRAIKRGDRVIVGAALPAFQGRSGAPDILVRDSSQGNGTHRYYPVDIKNHKPLKGTNKPQKHLISTLERIAKDDAAEEEIGPGSPISNDSLILSHYWRLLEGLKIVPEGEPFGAIISSDKRVVWRSLELSLREYDEEFATRLNALTALTEHKPPHTRPIWKSEWCSQCHWQEHCKAKLLAEQHVSLIKGINYARAVALQSAKPKPIRTWAELANVTAENLVMKGWPKPQTEVDHARARLSGSLFPFTPRESGDFSIPRAAVEIDFDMELIPESRAIGRPACVYLWGTLTTIRTEKVRKLLNNPPEGFIGFSIFESNETEDKAFASFWAWAQEWISKSKMHGFSLKFYCYHGTAENSAMKNVSIRAQEKRGIPSLDEIEEFKRSDYWVDIEEYVKHFIWPTEDQSLKTIGKIAGATWQEGASGQLSTVWFDSWTRSSDPAERESVKNQLLEYNKNDVEATLRVRDWINDGLASSQPRIVSIATLDGQTF